MGRRAHVDHTAVMPGRSSAALFVPLRWRRSRHARPPAVCELLTPVNARCTMRYRHFLCTYLDLSGLVALT